MRKTDRETVLKIPRLRAEGKTNEEIATVLGMKLRTLDYWVKRLKEQGYDMPVLTKGRNKIEL